MLLPLKQQAAQEQAQDSKPEPQRVNVACGNSLVLPVEILVQVATYVYIESPGEGYGNPPQYSFLRNPLDRGTWWVTVHGVAKSQTRLSD